jgi:hypothetical protein
MKLYIANCTSQSMVIHFRLPEAASALQQPIEMGGQSMIGSPNYGPQEIAHIIDQLRKYGLRSEEEISRDDGVIPMVFSRDRPVSERTIKSCISRNRGVLYKKGEDFRKLATIAADQKAVQALNEAPELRSNLGMMEMSVTEDSPGTIEHEGKPINDGYRIEHAADSGDGGRRGRRGRRAA